MKVISVFSSAIIDWCAASAQISTFFCSSAANDLANRFVNKVETTTMAIAITINISFKRCETSYNLLIFSMFLIWILNKSCVFVQTSNVQKKYDLDLQFLLH